MEREEVKDKQEAAIYVFTVRCIHFGKHDNTANCYIQIVTVIFLPLSFVSSLFGMNTGDIRTLEKGQWIFWAVAIPLTVIVIVLSLWYADNIGRRRSVLPARSDYDSQPILPPVPPPGPAQYSSPYYAREHTDVNRYDSDRRGIYPELPQYRKPFQRRL